MHTPGPGHVSQVTGQRSRITLVLHVSVKHAGGSMIPRQFRTVGLAVGDCDAVGATVVGADDVVGDVDAVGAVVGDSVSVGESVTPRTVGRCVGDAVGAVGAGVGASVGVEVGADVGDAVMHSPPQMMAQCLCTLD